MRASTTLLTAFYALGAATAAGCEGKRRASPDDHAGPAAARGNATPEPEPKPPPGLVAAPTEGDVAAVVADATKRATEDGVQLLVYVGASWCEPCTAFHDALVAGELDTALGGIRFLEFDHDRDAGRLQTAGYTSRLIPLFAIPAPDGRASGHQIEGGIKGPGAVAHIMERLVPLVRPTTP